MALLDEAVRVPHDAGEEPTHGLDHREHRDLSPVDDVVADADQAHAGPLGGVVEDALIDALVPAAAEHEVILAGELVRHRLGEKLARGRREDHERRLNAVRRLGEDAVERLAPRLRLHDHSGPAAVRGVVDGAVPVVGEIAQVVNGEVEEPGLLGLAEQGQLEDVEVAGEDRDDVDAHAVGRQSRGASEARSASSASPSAAFSVPAAFPVPSTVASARSASARSSSSAPSAPAGAAPSAAGAGSSSGSSSKSPAGGVTVTMPSARSTAGTMAFTNGTSTSVPDAISMASRSWAGRWSTRRTTPIRTPSRTTPRPTSWWSYQASSSSDCSDSSWLIQRMALTSVSATVRSGTPTKKPTGCALYQRSSASSSVLP